MVKLQKYSLLLHLTKSSPNVRSLIYRFVEGFQVYAFPFRADCGSRSLYFFIFFGRVLPSKLSTLHPQFRRRTIDVALFHCEFRERAGHDGYHMVRSTTLTAAGNRSCYPNANILCDYVCAHSLIFCV